jgi:hypothetical protein
VQPTKRSSAERKSAQVVVAMMGMDNITCPSEGPVAGCAVGVPASARMRGFGPQLAAARLSCGLGLGSLGCSPTPLAWRNAVVDCPGERRVRENRMHGVGGGGRKRAEDAEPCADRSVACRWRASRLPHRAGWAIEPRNQGSGVPTRLMDAEGNIVGSVMRELSADPARSKNLCMYGISMRENREVPRSPVPADDAPPRMDRGVAYRLGSRVAQERPRP